MKCKIRFGVFRKVKGKFEHKNGRCEIEGNYLDNKCHERVLEEIKKQYPGWSIHGYCEDIQHPIAI